MAPSAAIASAKAGKGDAVIGWKLDRGERAALLERFPPTYPNEDADHVTLRTGAGERAALPEENEAELIGRADDGRGVEAMVVRIAGTTDRPDGGVYHITWSLRDGREAKESNDVIAEQGWVALDEPVRVTLQPSRWARKGP
jgi:hypothetical protein